MKTLKLQTREMTLKRIGGDEFLINVTAGSYFINNKEIGVLIEINNSGIVLFDSFDEYWETRMDKDFWESLLKETHEPITDIEATSLSHVVEELRIESISGVNQIYLNDENWITDVFELVLEE